MSGRAFFWNKKTRAAIKDIEKAFSNGDRSAATYRFYADAYFESGDYKIAYRNYQVAKAGYEQEPFYRDIVRERASLSLALLGVQELRAGNPTGLHDLERAFSESPDNGMLSHQLNGMLLEDSVGQIVKTLFEDHVYFSDQTMSAIKRDPKLVARILAMWIPGDRHYEEARLLKAFATYEVGEHAKAKDMVIALVSEQEEGNLLFKIGIPIHPLFFFGVGYSHFKSGHILTALGWYDDLLEKFPDNPLAYDGISEALADAPQTIQKLIEKQEFTDAATLAERSSNFVLAAELYEKVARDFQEKDESESAFENYQHAADCFEKAGKTDQAIIALQNVHRLRKQPELSVSIDPPEKLVLNEWDALKVTVTNVGHGSAHRLLVKAEGPVTVHSDGTIPEIAINETKTVEIVFRPNEAGRRVPITVQITYEDSMGAQTLPPTTKFVTVARAEQLT